MQVIKSEKVNTNNGWGFGGWIGTVTTYDNGIIHKKGKFYYRHISPSKRDDWYVPVNDCEILIEGKVKDCIVYVWVNKTELPMYKSWDGSYRAWDGSYRAYFGKLPEKISIITLFNGDNPNRDIPNAKLIKEIPFNV